MSVAYAGWFGLRHGEAALLLFSVFFLIWCFCRDTVFHSRTEADEDLCGKSYSPTEIPTMMWVKIDGVVRGLDRGVIWNEEGVLYFYGHRSWFRLLRQDVVSKRTPTSRVLGGQPSNIEFSPLKATRTLFVEANGQLVEIGFRHLDPVVSGGLFRVLKTILQTQALFKKNSLDPIIDRFFASSARAHGSTQLPPLEFDRHFRLPMYPLALLSFAYLTSVFGLMVLRIIAHHGHVQLFSAALMAFSMLELTLMIPNLVKVPVALGIRVKRRFARMRQAFLRK